MCVSILAVCICFTASNTNSHYAHTGALDNHPPRPFFEYPIISTSSIAPKRILELSVQPNIKLILLCVSHHKYKVRMQQNQVILGAASHAKLQTGQKKKEYPESETCSQMSVLWRTSLSSSMKDSCFQEPYMFLSLLWCRHLTSFVTPLIITKWSKTSMQSTLSSNKRCDAPQNPIWGLWLCFGVLMSVYRFFSCVSWPDWLPWKLNRAGDLLVRIWLFISFAGGSGREITTHVVLSVIALHLQGNSLSSSCRPPICCCPFVLNSEKDEHL